MNDKTVITTDAKYRALSGVSKTFLEHASFLKKFLAKFLRNEQDIEDVAQEAFLKAYGAEQAKGGIDQPKAFLFSIAKNLALNELTRKSRQMTQYIDDCQPQLSLCSAATLEDEIQASYSIGMYCEAVVNLPEKCRRVYLLRKVHGLSHKEIAKRLNISLSSVEKHISIGSLSCRDYMLRREENNSSASQIQKKAAVTQLGGNKNG